MLRSVELPKKEATALKLYLKALHVSYQSSECYNNIYFEMAVNEEEEQQINTFIDSII